MVDAVVSLAVSKLGEFLESKVALRRSLKGNVEWLRSELRLMQAYLKEAEEKQALRDLRVQEIQREINSISNAAVTILETYNSNSGDGGDRGCASCLKAYTCFCRKEAKFQELGEEIQSLKQRVMDISRKRETYAIPDTNINAGEGPSNPIPDTNINAGEGPSNNNRSAMVTAMRRTSSFMDEDHFLVGFEDVVEKILALLLNGEPRRSVISIYGMGGLGKTTLAKAFYNSPSITSSFSTRAWICITQDYSTPDDHLRSVIKTIEGCTKKILDLLEKMTQTDLERRLRGLLEQRKYLLVVDDVWHKEAWESLKRAFPDNKNGSRVIITTRKQDVAESADRQGFPHKLRFLGQEESWNLFCEKLRRVNMYDEIGHLSPAMERIAREMVERCEGLPLAINILGGLLCHKEGLEEWQRVKANIWWHMQDDSIDQISPLLTLSYNDLSTPLNHCFLYFGMFPEDSVIDSEKMMWLWMAEGLVIPRGREQMEDIAERFLMELIKRSLIQVEKTFWGNLTKCRIHDLLRDLAVKKATEIEFFDIYYPRNSVPPSCDRQAIQAQPQRYISLEFSKFELRSLLFFDWRYIVIDDFRKICIMFQHLHVLDLEGSSTNELPDTIGNLINLRFLGLTDTCIYSFPPSIGKLVNLQTLDVIVRPRVCKLPPQMSNLVNLRHLIARYDQPLQLSKFTSLRTLKFINCDQFKDIDELNLPNLQELVMENIERDYSLNAIGSLRSLTTLMLGCRDFEKFPPLEPLSSCVNLNKLWLHGEIRQLPLLPKLITEMVLQYSRLKTDPMPVLGALENLRDLRLVCAYHGDEITCGDDSFGQLKFLHLEGLSGLERWNLATSAMPLIKGLGIYGCLDLKEIPERLKNVAILEKPSRKHGDRLPLFCTKELSYL